VTRDVSSDQDVDKLATANVGSADLDSLDLHKRSGERAVLREPHSVEEVGVRDMLPIDIEVTSQHPVSFIGWGIACATGACLWTILISWVFS
jgi:hypothetical protein